MKKIILLALLAMASTLHAGEKMQTREQCEGKCLPMANQPSDKLSVHQQKLKNIRAKKAGVSDAGQLKALQEEEEAEIDRFEAAHEKFCKQICSYFPETL